MKRLCVYLTRFIVVVVTLLCVFTARAEITIEAVQPTDVTSSGFAIIWQTSETAVPGIAIFSDAAGISEITRNLEISPFPLWGGDPAVVDEYLKDEGMADLRNQAMTRGLMKIGVYGCVPQATYYYRVYAEGSGGQVVSWPSVGLAAVTTTKENTFVSDSKQLLVTLVDNEGTLDATGWLVTASSGETLSPISAIVGDGAGVNQAYLNLSHLFGTEELNWMPSGAKDITLEVRGFESGPLSYILSLDFSNRFSVSTVYLVTINLNEPQDSDEDGLPDSLENRVGSCTDRFDADTDDDGIIDGMEDANQDGAVNSGETDPCNSDTDGDGIQDGTELGANEPVPDPDGDGPLLGTNTDLFIPDANPITTTDPLDDDSDDDLIPDGAEDADRNGTVDPGETDPLTDDAFDDADGDGFCNLREYLGSSNAGDSADRPANTIVYVDDDSISGIEDGTPDHPLNTIQKGVNFAGPGDTVFVLAGDYPENVIIEKSIYLVGEGHSVTNIDGSGEALPAIRCIGLEYGSIEGLRVRNGTSAGIRCEQATLWIERVILSDTSNGHGIEVGEASSVTLFNNVIYSNDLDGLRSQGQDMEAVNNSIVNNGGNGIYYLGDSVVVIKNNIIVDNKGYGISCSELSEPRISFNNIFSNLGGSYSSGLSEGIGDIHAAPMFKDSADYDYHLTAISPCIDAGTSFWTPELDIERRCRYDAPEVVNSGGGRYDFFDMGAYEYIGLLRTDLNGNGHLDREDMAHFASQFGSTMCPECEADLDGDADVDGSDLAAFVAEQARLRCPTQPCEGDLDWDLDVDGLDLTIFSKDYGRRDCDQGEACVGDFDKNLAVDWFDLESFTFDYGRSDCPISSR